MPTTTPLTVVAAVLATLAGSLSATPALASSPSIAVTCASSEVSLAKSQPTTFALECSAVNGDPIDGYTVVAAPSRAAAFSLSPTTGKGSYTPAAGFTGVDGLTFTATSGTATSEPTKVAFVVSNTPPSCAPLSSLTVAHDRAVATAPACTDPDGDALTFVAGTKAPQHGTLTVDGARLVYTPAARFTGSDVLSFRASDGAATSAEQSVDVQVTNTAPTCRPVSVSARHDRPVLVPLTCADAEGDTVTVSVVARGQHGTVTPVGAGAARYTPAARYVGADTFTFAANDGLVSGPAARASVTVTNTAPTCSAPSRLALRNSGAVTVTCTDRDGDAVLVEVVKAPRRGTLSIHGRTVTYRANRGFSGTDAFVVRGFDGVARSADRGVSVSVLPAVPSVASATVTARGASAVVSCGALVRACTGQAVVAVTVGKRTISGVGSFRLAAGRDGTVAVSFDRAERRLLAASRATSLPVRVTLTTRDSSGRAITVARSMSAARAV